MVIGIMGTIVAMVVLVTEVLGGEPHHWSIAILFFALILVVSWVGPYLEDKFGVYD